MRTIDRWAVLRVRRLSRRAQKAYRDYEYHVVFHQVHNFCAVDMGGFYLDALKDRLYCDGAASLERRSAQTALWEILHHADASSSRRCWPLPPTKSGSTCPSTPGSSRACT